MQETTSENRSPLGRTGFLFTVIIAASIGYSAHVLSEDELTEEDRIRATRLIEQYACRSCHVIGGSGAAVGPDLGQVTLRRSDEWLMQWLESPSRVKPGTLMPAFKWNDGDREVIIAYLRQYEKPVDAERILENHKGAEAGHQLIEAYQCYACHKIADHDGRPLYPDLNKVAERRDPDWERKWLKDPQAVIEGTFMPNFYLSDKEIEAIVQFLYP